MIRHIARMTSLVLAFGFFFGCTVLENAGGEEEQARRLATICRYLGIDS